MNIGLTDRDVEIIAGVPVKLLLFKDAHQYNSIDSVFGQYKCVLLNYLTSDNFGHWVGLYKNGNKIIYFDSYGMFMDEPIAGIPADFRKSSNQYYPYILDMLLDWQLENPKVRSVHYNELQLQAVANNVKTCGRWVGFFFRRMQYDTLEDFQDAFIYMKYDSKYKNPSDKKFYDKLITKVTDIILNN